MIDESMPLVRDAELKQSSTNLIENVPAASQIITSNTPRVEKVPDDRLLGLTNGVLLPAPFAEQIPANQAPRLGKDALHDTPFEIRPREPPNTTNQALPYSFSSVSTANSKKRPHDVIDLTEDDDDYEPSPPRKKSFSSCVSSDESIEVVASSRRPSRHTPESKDLHRTTGDVQPKKELPATHENERAQKPVPSHHSSRSPSSKFASRLSSKPASRSPSREASAQKQHPLQQYASAVIIPPNDPLGEFTPDEVQQRRDFQRNIAAVSDLTLSNTIDHSSPPTSFRFLKESVLSASVHKAPADIMVGCECRRKRGGNECKYPNECSCLRDSNGESKVKRSQYHDSPGLRKGCLMKHILQNRFNIFECNPRCDCSDNCKNRVVQWGRKVGLDIFKTRERGWGLRCDRDLLEGQFIDTYRGEIITSEEADRRKKGANEDNYFMDFDKFEDAIYVCDGMYMGGPTRFMNHSCEPNCALFTVSYNHYDPYIYELAFFAKEFIPKGTELTFDYQDLDQDDGEGGKITEEDAKEMEKEKGYAPSVCRCGAESCRGYFFFLK